MSDELEVGLVAEGEARNVAETAALLGSALATARVVPGQDGQPYAIVPPGYEIQTLNARAYRPHRKSGQAKFGDAESFLAFTIAQHINRNEDEAGERTCVYYGTNPPRFIAVLNDTQINPGFGDYRARFEVPFSREWREWTSQDGKQQTQIDFAHFIERNMLDIAAPSGAELMELVLDFEAARSGKFRSTQKLQNGATNFVWIDEDDARGAGNQLKIPQFFSLQIPVFDNEAPCAIDARLRYKITPDQKLMLWYELVRAHKVADEEFTRIRDLVKAELSNRRIPLYFGDPAV